MTVMGRRGLHAIELFETEPKEAQHIAAINGRLLAELAKFHRQPLTDKDVEYVGGFVEQPARPLAKGMKPSPPWNRIAQLRGEVMERAKDKLNFKPLSRPE